MFVQRVLPRARWCLFTVSSSRFRKAAAQWTVASADAFQEMKK